MSQACKKCSSTSVSERKEYDREDGEEYEYTICTCNNCGNEWSPGGEILGTVAGYAALASAGTAAAVMAVVAAPVLLPAAAIGGLLYMLGKKK